MTVTRLPERHRPADQACEALGARDYGTLGRTKHMEPNSAKLAA